MSSVCSLADVSCTLSMCLILLMTKTDGLVSNLPRSRFLYFTAEQLCELKV